jgi:hypothetical protein
MLPTTVRMPSDERAALERLAAETGIPAGRLLRVGAKRLEGVPAEELLAEEEKLEGRTYRLRDRRAAAAG